MARKLYGDDRLFRFHWFGGKREDGYGRTVGDAFSRLGYGGGAIRALDWYEELTEPSPVDDEQH